MTMPDHVLNSVLASQGLTRTAKSPQEFDVGGSGLPHSEDLALFQKMFNSLPLSTTSVARLSSEPSLLGGLSDYMSGRRNMVANHLSGIMNTRDPAAIIEVGKEMLDQSVEQDLLVKVISKSVSAIDQLTKLN